MKFSLNASYSKVVCLALLLTTSIACDQLEKLNGKKPAEEATTQSEAEKIAAITAQVKQQLIEEQKQAAEAQAKHEQEIAAEVEKRLAEIKAKEAAQAPAAVAPTTTTPAVTAQAPAVAPAPAKVKTAPATSASEEKAPAAPKKQSGYVKIFEHKGNFGSSLTLGFNQNASDTDHVRNDQEFNNFKDNCSSATYDIPAGWKVVLYEHTHFQGRGYPLTGSGQVGDLGYMNDKCSSVRWEQGN